MNTSTELKQAIQHFWNEHHCGVKFVDEQLGTAAFFEEIERFRYALEPHILEMAPFNEVRGCRVLELGCGAGTDGAQFAKKIMSK